MSVVPYEQTQQWLSDARAAVSQEGWPTKVFGPQGAFINVAHNRGFAVLGQQEAIKLEVLPGVVAPLEELEIRYQEAS